MRVAIMTDSRDPVGDAVRSAVREAIERRFGYPLEYLEVVADEDSSGDPILRIEAGHPFRERAVDMGLAYGLIGEVRDALEQEGEYRFPLIRHHFHEDQAVAS